MIKSLVSMMVIILSSKYLLFSFLRFSCEKFTLFSTFKGTCIKVVLVTQSAN